MKKQNTVQEPKKNYNKPQFSEATMKVARENIRQLETQADEDFLVRAEMDKKLSSFW